MKQRFLLIDPLKKETNSICEMFGNTILCPGDIFNYANKRYVIQRREFFFVDGADQTVVRYICREINEII